MILCVRCVLWVLKISPLSTVFSSVYLQKCLLQDRKVSDHDCVCYGYQFLPFQRFWYFILELFWQCGILLFLFYYSLLNIGNKKRKCMTKETVISFTMLVKASKSFIIKVGLPFASTWVHPWFTGGDHVAHLFSFLLIVVLLCAFTFWVPCCDIRCVIRIQTMFASSLHPVIYGRGYVLFSLFEFLFCLFASCVLCTKCCQFLRIVHFWLPFRYFLMFI